MFLLQYLLIALSVLGIISLFWQIRRGNMDWFSSIKWFVAWCAVLVVAIEPAIADWLANLFGTGRGADLLIYLSILFIFALIFKLFLKINQVERQISDLVSHLAQDKAHKKKD
ncbi:MAG TPA: DUF2304 domain-containing protein [bacterium]|nr:DUF2304 domain-containing protein [bacterium]